MSHTELKAIPTRRAVGTRRPELVEGADPRARNLTAAAVDAAEPLQFDDTPPVDVTFSRGPARRPAPAAGDPLLQWATGLPTGDRQIYAGWLLEVGQDADLDTAMQDAGVRTVVIRHGNGNLVTHWRIESAPLFVVAEGVQSISEMQHTTERYGIAFGWGVHPQSGRPQSQLRCRVFLRPLLAVGWERPLLVALRGTLTGDFVQALMQQYAVLDACAAERQKTGKSPALPFYAFSLPLGPGQAQPRGTTQTKDITPMRAQVPTAPDAAYLKTHWTRRAWVPVIESLLDATVAWSVSESARIAAGELREEA